jgi:hypothetical protein
MTFLGRKSRDTRLIRLGSVGLRLGHGKRKKRARLTARSAHQRSKEGGRTAAATPGPAHADARESGEETAAQFGSAQRKEGEEGAGQRGAGLQATGLHK